MNATRHSTASSSSTAQRWWAIWAGLLAFTLLCYLLKDSFPWLFKYPRAWTWPLRFWISDFMKWLMNSLDFGLFTFREATRFFSWIIEQPYWVAKSLLSSGFLKGQGSGAIEIFPRLPWVGVIGIVMLMGWKVGGRNLSLLVGACFLYLAAFGQWDSAMTTLSSIVISVPLGVFGGLLLGIQAHRSAHFNQALSPILDLMQTVPVFAYLVPVLILFGFGPVSAMIATIIYAMPPMVRITILALQKVPDEIVEFGKMAGCSSRQLLMKVQLPTAKPAIMVGVNQVVMLSLNMVIIASMIGAGGLGFDVLNALRRLKIGEGIEAGVAITLLAIALDRLSQAFANQPQPAQILTSQSLLQKHPYLLASAGIAITTWLLGLVVPAVQIFPEEWQVSTGSFWGDVVRYININYFDELDAVKNFLLLNIMIPTKRFLLSLPWVAVVIGVSIAGARLGGWRLAMLAGLSAIFIATVGLWPKAMITIYLCGLSVIIACMIGIPIGVAASRNENLHRIVQVVIDTLQTLPSFVYLMPVVMLFRVGDFAAMLAVIAYAVVPAIRYTDHGIRNVPPHLIEAAIATGCTKRQILWKVQMPLALPEIMLGINQTIMMALSMLVITALVGTRDLGQEVYIALTKADIGRGIVAGLAIALIAIIVDRLIGAWSNKRKRELGIG